MIYYIFGFLVSVISLSFFLGGLRATTGTHYDWMVIFSLAFLSGAGALVFFVGLVSRVVQSIQRRKPQARRAVKSTAAVARQVLLPTVRTDQLLGQSEFARRWIHRRTATYDETKRANTRYGRQMSYRLKSQGRADASSEDCTLRGFKNIKQR